MGTFRIWNNFGTSWGDLEPEKGQWNWEVLDNCVNSARQHGVQRILLTLGQTPGWASSNPDVVTYIGESGGVLAPNGPNQSLHEWMRNRHVRNRLDFGHLEDSKIGLPLVESIQRIMIRAEVFGQTLPVNRSLEHPAERNSIYDAAVDAEPYDTTCKLVTGQIHRTVRTGTNGTRVAPVKDKKHEDTVRSNSRIAMGWNGAARVAS